MGVITMSDLEQKRYSQVLEVLHGRLSIVELSLLIDKSYSQAKRIVKKVMALGMLGIKHGNAGKVPYNKTPDDVLIEIEELLRTDYSNFNLTHFKEMIETHEGIVVGKNVIHQMANKHGLIKRPKRRRKKIHKLRPRMPKEGMLVQFDGSEHPWFGKIICDLIAGIDDATGEVVGAEFFIGETSLHCMKVMKGIALTKGIPQAYYLDGAGYFGKHDYHTETQIGRALESLNCDVRIASSAQAKGRIERLWNTFQDRLVAELEFYKITTIEDANTFLKTDFLPRYNKKFSSLPRETSSCYRPVQEHANLDLIFCIKEKRKVSGGMNFSWENIMYILDEEKDYRFRTISINKHINGEISFDVRGTPVKVKKYSSLGKSEDLLDAA